MPVHDHSAQKRSDGAKRLRNDFGPSGVVRDVEDVPAKALKASGNAHAVEMACRVLERARERGSGRVEHHEREREIRRLMSSNQGRAEYRTLADDQATADDRLAVAALGARLRDRSDPVITLLVGVASSEFFLPRISLLLLIVGMIVFLAGWAHLAAVAFPLGFLVLMLPSATIASAAPRASPMISAVCRFWA